MRCPKCHYLSFDPEPRCRNCGYDLEVADTDLALKTAEGGGAPLPDLTLRARPPASAAPVTLEIVRPAHPPEAMAECRLALDESADVGAEKRVATETAVAPTVDAPVVLPPPVTAPLSELRRSPSRAPHTTAELPLFVKGLADRKDFPDESMIGSMRHPVAAALPTSRPPLAVRRAVPESARTRPKPAVRRLGPLDNDLLEDLKRVEREEAAQARADARAAAAAIDESRDRVEPLHRIAAAAVDTVVLGGIAAFVLWGTLRLCAVSLSDFGVAALVPLILFLVVMDVSYLLMFTVAGGQTVGKMLMGIRVVGDGTEDGDQVSVRRAAWRAALTVVSVLGLGLGWLPALFGRGVSLHDRLAHTRVVRA